MASSLHALLKLSPDYIVLCNFILRFKLKSFLNLISGRASGQCSFSEPLNIDKYMYIIFEPSREKTNNVVSEQVRHKSGCTITEAG